MNDGLFDVMELDLGFFRQNLHNISVLSSMHFYAPVEVRNARRMRITPYDACNILVDGEIIGNVTDCTIKILPGRISCFCTI
jgi:diacylglycerol kinase family enzyme